MTQTIKAVTAATTLALLAACSSGSSGGGGTESPDVDVAEAVDIVDVDVAEPIDNDGAVSLDVGDVNNAFADVTDLAGSLDNGDIDLLSTNELFALGSASYEGTTILIPDDAINIIVGRTQIDADFENGGSLDGSITDLVQIDGENADGDFDSTTGALTFDEDTPLFAVDGTLTLSNGNIQELSPVGEIDIDVTGDLTLPGALTEIEQNEVFSFEGALTANVTDGSLIALGDVIANNDREDSDIIFSTISTAEQIQ